MRKEKQLLLDDVKGHFDRFSSFVIMRYEGLKANDAHALRIAVADTGGEVEMVPKRILSKAAEAAGFKIETDGMKGHIGLVFAGEDAVQTTKTFFKFRKSTNQAIEAIGGRFEGEFISAADVEMYSKLPSKNEMRAQLLSTFIAPMTQSLATMNALLTSVLYCLENKAKQAECE